MQADLAGCPRLPRLAHRAPPRCCLSVCVPVTNINDGLLRGISMLNKAREERRVPERSTSIVIMLTDGDANVGEAGWYGSERQPCFALWPAPCKALGSSSQGPPESQSPSRARPRLLLLGPPNSDLTRAVAVTLAALHMQRSASFRRGWSREPPGRGCSVSTPFPCRGEQTGENPRERAKRHWGQIPLV